MAETVEVPFITVGNHRCLTDAQLAAHSWLADFVRRFASSFEHDEKRGLWIYREQ